MALVSIGGGGFGKLTQTAGTRIQKLAGNPPKHLFSHLTNLRVTTGATAHTVTLMGRASKSTAASALAAAGTALVVVDALTDGDANAPASGDAIAVKLDNGDWHLSLISGWNSGTKTLTLSTAIPTGRSVVYGAAVLCYGAAGDTYHSKNQIASGAGATNNFPAVSIDGNSIFRAPYPGEPLLIDIDNGTNASTIEYGSFGYARH